MATVLHVQAMGSFQSGSWQGEIANCGWTFPLVDEDILATPAINEDIAEFPFDNTGGTGTWDHGNVLYGFGGDLLTQANQNSIANAVYGWIQALKAYQATTFSWTNVQLVLQQYNALLTKWEQKYDPSMFVINPKVAGTVASNILPPQCSITVSHYTDGSGSRNRGRLYVPWHNGSTVVNQLLNTAATTALLAAEDAFLKAVRAVDLDDHAWYFVPAVVSKVHRTFSSITQLRVGDEVDTQRRRRNGRVEIYTSQDYPAA